MTVANLVLRVTLCLSIVAVAIGMTAAASTTVTPCAERSCDPDVASAAYARPGGPADIAVSTGTAATATSAAADAATALVVLVTVVVLSTIFVILLSYRPRPGGVRAPHR